MVSVMVIVNKGSNCWYVFALMGYSSYAVKAGVTRHINIVDAYSGEQLFAFLILYKEVGEAFEHMGIGSAIPTEEHLSWTEDTADAIYGHSAMAQNVHIVVPELVLYEEGYGWSYGAQKAQCVGGGVDGQIAHQVSQFVVFAHLIS